MFRNFAGVPRPSPLATLRCAHLFLLLLSELHAVNWRQWQPPCTHCSPLLKCCFFRPTGNISTATGRHVLCVSESHPHPLTHTQLSLKFKDTRCCCCRCSCNCCYSCGIAASLIENIVSTVGVGVCECVFSNSLQRSTAPALKLIKGPRAAHTHTTANVP